MSKTYRDHTHTYERSLSNKEIYRCIARDCTHYQRREFLKDKEALCNTCHEPFILTWDQLKNKRPVCINCSKSKKAVQIRSVADQISDLFKEVPITTEQMENLENQIVPPIVKEKEMEWE